MLYTIFTYKRCHRKPLLSDSGRNMYLKLSFNFLFFTLIDFCIVFQILNSQCGGRYVSLSVPLLLFIYLVIFKRSSRPTLTYSIRDM